MSERLESIQVNVHLNILEKCKQKGITVDIMGSVLLVLSALYLEKYDILDAFDDGNKEKRALLIYQTLLRKGLIEETDATDKVIYQLTKDGLSFIENVKQELEQPKEKKETTEQTKDDIESWIKEWIHLFPESKVNGRYLRSNSKECLEKMKWFIKTYGFDKTVIFEATRQYLFTQEQSASGHAFTRNSTYFISKNQGRSQSDKSSDLATWCELIINQKASGVTPTLDDPFAKLM